MEPDNSKSRRRDKHNKQQQHTDESVKVPPPAKTDNQVGVEAQQEPPLSLSPAVLASVQQHVQSLMPKNQCYENMNLIIPTSTGGKGGVYLGDLKAAQDHQKLISKNVRFVLSVIPKGGGTITVYKDVGITQLVVDAQDESGFNITSVFKQAFDFLDKARQTSNVLIHCVGGRSRSASVLCAYYVKTFRKSAAWALAVLQTIRPVVNPNPGFQLQLKNFSNYMQANDYVYNGESFFDKVSFD